MCVRVCVADPETRAVNQSTSSHQFNLDPELKNTSKLCEEITLPIMRPMKPQQSTVELSMKKFPQAFAQEQSLQ